MKTYIDLLPEGKKKEIQKERTVRAIIAQEFGLAFPVAFLVVIMLVMNLVLKIQIESIEVVFQNEQSLASHQELGGYEEKFKEINSKLALVSKIQDSHLEWVPVLTKLSQLFPEGVYVNGIATKDYRIFLIGKAQKRESLLNFQEAISASECFANINAPLSNLVSKENIDFQIDFEVKKECIKTK